MITKNSDRIGFRQFTDSFIVSFSYYNFPANQLLRRANTLIINYFYSNEKDVEIQTAFKKNEENHAEKKCFFDIKNK